MYLVAGLFALWALVKLAGGDYVGAVIGLAVGSIFAVGQYFWDALGGDNTWQRLKIPVAVGVMIAGLAVVAVMLLEEIEISAERYVSIEQATREFPALRADARQAMSDRKISIVEFYDLEKAYHDLAKRRAMEHLLGE